MISKDKQECCSEKYCRPNNSCPQNGAVYGLGFVGAVVYFIGQATTFGTGVLGLLKAIVWPAFLVYEALKFLIK
jgi:hypothetical protein